VKNGAGSGGKWLDVSAERFPRWIVSFSVRHGVSDDDQDPGDGAAGVGPAASVNQTTAPWPMLPRAGGLLAVTFGDDHASFTAADGSVAECYPPFPPPGGVAPLAAAVGADFATDAASTTTDADASYADIAALTEAFAAHARRPRTIGVLLVRLGGYAAGVFAGYPPALLDAKVGSRLVHGRSAAGGWSQHRFARRREKQANEALDAAADAAVLVFGKAPGKGPAGLDAVVLGGDRRAIAELRDDPRLAPYFQLAAERFLTVPDPKRAVLLETPRLFTAIRIRLTEA
jgi:hypothetical protein